MGREVRKVPPNWAHPERDPQHDPYCRRGFQPMFNQRYEDAMAEWLEDFDRIRAGQMDDIERECYPGGVVEWASDNTAPARAYYRPWADEEATWFQVWETVSEGTPVTPPFATKEELVEYLCANGDFWDQSRGDGGWRREDAVAFVGAGWAPSLVVHMAADKSEIMAPRDFASNGIGST